MKIGYLVIFLFITVKLLALEIDGQGNALILDSESSLWVITDDTLTLKNLVLKNLSAERLVMEAPSSNLILDNCTIIFDGNYSFTQGDLIIQNMVDFVGAFTFAQTTTSNVIISANSTLLLDRDFTYSYDARPFGADTLNNSKSKLIMTDNTSFLHLKGATLHTTWTGAILSTGGLIVEDKCILESEARVDQEASVLQETTLDINVLGSANFILRGIIETT